MEVEDAQGYRGSWVFFCMTIARARHDCLDHGVDAKPYRSHTRNCVDRRLNSASSRAEVFFQAVCPSLICDTEYSPDVGCGGIDWARPAA